MDKRRAPGAASGFLAAGFLTAALGGCTVGGAVVGAGAAGGIAIAQERSVGDAVDDSGIRLKFNARLLDEHSNLYPGVSTEVVEGRMLLAGQVPTPEDRVTVTRLAWKIPGVREVINELTVADTSGVLDYASDVWISSQLRAQLLADANVLAINYTIETVNGVVFLLGVAQSPAELTRATNHARTIDGVKRVVSYVLDRTDPHRGTTVSSRPGTPQSVTPPSDAPPAP